MSQKVGSKRILILGCLSVLNCALIAMVSGQSSCEFLSSKPRRLIRSTGHSSDNQAVVSASAYLRYQEDHFENSLNSSQARYLPLLFKNYDFDPRDLFGHPILILEADCAKLIMTFNKVGHDYQVDAIDVVLNIPNKSVKVCTISKPQMAQEEKRHYSCDLSLTPRACKARIGGEKVDIVDVVFTKLEFEIFVPMSKAMYDEFSLPDTTC